MRRRLLGILAAGALTAAIAVVGAGPANAAPWTVGPTPPTGPFTFTGAAGQTFLTDTTTGTVLTCSSSTANGGATRGSGQPGPAIARITATTFTNCIGPLNIMFTVQHIGTWLLNAVTPTGNGATGTITAIQARLSGPLCSATVSGSVPAAFINSDNAPSPSQAQLQVQATNPGTLTITNVSGCFGLIRNNDRASFRGTYNITNPVPLRITSP